MALSIRHLSLTLISFFCLLLSNGRAQTAETFTPQFRIVSMIDAETVLFDIDENQMTLSANVGTFSSIYRAPKDGNIVFYKESPNPNPELPPIKTPLAKAQLATDTIGPYLILLIRNPLGAELEFSTVVLDHSLEEFPANTYRVYNYSKRQLAVRLAETDLLLKTGESSSIDYPVNTNSTDLKVAANDQDEGWLVVRAAPQPVGSNSRTTLFLVDIPPSQRDPNPLGIITRSFKERIRTDESGRQRIR